MKPASPMAFYRRLGYEECGVIVWTTWHGGLLELPLMELLLDGDGEQ